MANELTPQKPTMSGALQAMGFTRASRSYFCSLSEDEPKYKDKLFALLQKKGDDIRGYINREVKIVAFLAFNGTLVDERSGEEMSTLICKIELSDGTIVSTHSGGVATTLSARFDLFGPPSRKQPYVCTPVTRTLRDGTRSMFDLDFPVA